MKCAEVFPPRSTGRPSVSTNTVIMHGSEESISMISALLQHCTIADLFLLIFGILVLLVAGTATLWFLFVVCVFILGKAYLRGRGVFSVCAVHGPPRGGDDWDDDDDGIATGLYD